MSKNSTRVVNTASADPLTPDYFLRRVLVPEVTLFLITKDLALRSGDPKAKITLEASRDFGNALQSIEHEDEITKAVMSSSSEGYEESNLVALPDQLILRILPRFVMPHIKSTFDPPAFEIAGTTQ